MWILRRFVRKFMGQRDEERLREEVEEHIALQTSLGSVQWKPSRKTTGNTGRFRLSTRSRRTCAAH